MIPNPSPPPVHTGAAKCPRGTCPSDPKLRDWDSLLALLNKLKGASSSELTRSFTNYGLNKLVFAWNPEYIPYANPTKLPTDLLHLGGDGLLRSEGAWMFFTFGRMGLSLEKFNSRLRTCVAA